MACCSLSSSPNSAMWPCSKPSKALANRRGELPRLDGVGGVASIDVLFSRVSSERERREISMPSSMPMARRNAERLPRMSLHIALGGFNSRFATLHAGHLRRCAGCCVRGPGCCGFARAVPRPARQPGWRSAAANFRCRVPEPGIRRVTDPSSMMRGLTSHGVLSFVNNSVGGSSPVVAWFLFLQLDVEAALAGIALALRWCALLLISLFYRAARVLAGTPWCINNLLITME